MKKMFQRRESVKSDWIENWCHWDLADFSSFLDLAKFWVLCAHKKWMILKVDRFLDLLKFWVLFARKQKVNNFGGIGDRTKFCLGAVEGSSTRTRTSTPRRQEQNFHQGTGDRRDCAQESKIWTEASGPETKIPACRCSLLYKDQDDQSATPQPRESRKFEGAVL